MTMMADSYRYTTILCYPARVAPGVLPRRSLKHIRSGGGPRGAHWSRVRHPCRGALGS
jgi:hypothetical protein